MKKILLVACTVLFGTMLSQNTAKDLFNTNSIVWYGLNFSQAKMVGQFDQAVGAGAASASEIKNKWISAWNGLIISEPQNFKLAEAFNKDEVYNDLAPTDKQNQTIKNDDLMSSNDYSFADPKKTVNSIISKLSGGDKTEGIGVTFIVESFNKITNQATVYVTVFDIKTKTVLITEKVTGKPAGIGLRNFWGGAIKHIIKQIKSDYYSKWKSANK